MTTTEAILVPVLNEEAAIGPVLAELAPHAVGRRVYLLDGGSHDRTVAEAQCRARDCGLDLAVIDCPPGLATAIRSGFEQVPEEHLAVIDGDGQHEPKILDTLFQDLRDGRDLAVGSRYVANASIPRDWPRHRYAGSVVLLWLACATVRCHGIRDPFAGCFAVRREAWERVAGRFETGGYKFLLDFLAASPGLRVAERPVEYRARRAGASKMSFAVFWGAAGLHRKWCPSRRRAEALDQLRWRRRAGSRGGGSGARGRHAVAGRVDDGRGGQRGGPFPRRATLRRAVTAHRRLIGNPEPERPSPSKHGRYRRSGWRSTACASTRTGSGRWTFAARSGTRGGRVLERGTSGSAEYERRRVIRALVSFDGGRPDVRIACRGRTGPPLATARRRHRRARGRKLRPRPDDAAALAGAQPPGVDETLIGSTPAPTSSRSSRSPRSPRG